MIRVPRAARDKGAEQAKFVSDFDKVAYKITDDTNDHVKEFIDELESLLTVGRLAVTKT